MLDGNLKLALLTNLARIIQLQCKQFSTGKTFCLQVLDNISTRMRSHYVHFDVDLSHMPIVIPWMSLTGIDTSAVEPLDDSDVVTGKEKQI